MRILTPYGSLQNWNAWDEMDRFLNDVVVSSFEEKTFKPKSEVSEEEKHFHLSLDLPGLREEDIKIELSDNVLSISGERKRIYENKAAKEKSYGLFERKFSVPDTIDTDKIEVHFENGVLDCYLPKKATSQPRRLEIQSNKKGFFDKLLNTKKENSTHNNHNSNLAS